MQQDKPQITRTLIISGKAKDIQLIIQRYIDKFGKDFPVELLIKPIQNGYRFKEIGIDYKERMGEVTVNRLSSVVWTIKRIFKLKFRKTKKG